MSNDARSALSALGSRVRIGQFVSVGVVGATVETLILAALTAGLAASPQAAKVVGAEASITLMFLLNERFTFSEAGEGGPKALGRRYLKSHAVRLGGLAVGFAVLTLLTDYTSIRLVIAGADFWPTVANGVGIGCGMVLNYLSESLFTWQIHR